MYNEINKTKKIITWIISGLLTALFLFSAAGKFTDPSQLAGIGLGSYVILIAIGEIVSTLLFLNPKTNIYGSLLLSSYMGGAIIIHMMFPEMGGFLFQSVVLVLIWAVAFIRNPRLLKA